MKPRELPPWGYAGIAPLGALIFGGVFWLGVWHATPKPAPQPNVYRVVRYEPRSHQPQTAIVRAYSERDARELLAAKWSDRTWLDEQAATCWREDASQQAAVLMELMTP